MKINWSEQTVVITGAYGSLGLELCKSLSARGADLILTGRNLDKLQQLKKILPQTTKVVSGNIASRKFKDDLVACLEGIKTAGHMLINNAGISDVRFLEQLTDDSIKNMLVVNLLTPMLLSKKLMPWLKKAQSAKIINIGSTFGAIGYPGFSGYCATKFGLRGFTQALDRELADTNISVQYLAPRAIATNMNSDKVNLLNKKLNNDVDTLEQILPQIIKAIEKGRTEIFFGWPAKLFVKLNGLFPSIVANAINKEHKIIKQIIEK
ncbi:MAG: SDR family oxidoreductase [Alcanivoracaceae bacterium]|nr:SDR family oxidoreductase [Alcanivoracaceae bacterium]